MDVNLCKCLFVFYTALEIETDSAYDRVEVTIPTAKSRAVPLGSVFHMCGRVHAHTCAQPHSADAKGSDRRLRLCKVWLAVSFLLLPVCVFHIYHGCVCSARLPLPLLVSRLSRALLEYNTAQYPPVYQHLQAQVGVSTPPLSLIPPRSPRPVFCSPERASPRLRCLSVLPAPQRQGKRENQPACVTRPQSPYK